jgi:hypothetical protein
VQDIISDPTKLMAFLASISAFFSAIAALLALYFYRVQARWLKSDLRRRSLVDEQNYLNISRYYRMLVLRWKADLENCKDSLGVMKTLVEDEKNKLRISFKGVTVPDATIYQYHFINYKPAESYEIMRAQHRIEDLAESLRNYNQVFDEKFKARMPTETLNEELRAILESVDIECRALISDLASTEAALKKAIRSSEQSVEFLENAL